MTASQADTQRLSAELAKKNQETTGLSREIDIFIGLVKQLISDKGLMRRKNEQSEKNKVELSKTILVLQKQLAVKNREKAAWKSDIATALHKFELYEGKIDHC